MNQMNRKIKQIIILRKDLTVRRGKMHVQAAHASNGFLQLCALGKRKLSDVEYDWITLGNRKICVGVNSEEELLKIFNLAEQEGIFATLVTDAGMTEFNGRPTNTAVALGPDLDEKLDKLTGHLTLL